MNKRKRKDILEHDNRIELNLSEQEIFKLTPYLENDPEKDFYLSKKQRLFAWFYCANGFIILDAVKRAGYTYGKQLKNKDQNAVLDPKKAEQSLAITGQENIRNPNVKKAIRMILDDQISIIKNPLEKMICEVLMVKAFYDEAMFIRPDGSPAFTNWDDIPKAYRCCVVGIEKRFFGKDCQREVRTIKLADKDKALEKLSDYIGMMQSKEPFRVDLTTGGKPLNQPLDLSKLSAEELNNFETLLSKVTQNKTQE